MGDVEGAAPTAEENALNQLNKNTVSLANKPKPDVTEAAKGNTKSSKPGIKETKVPVVEEKRLEAMWRNESKKPDETLSKDQVLSKMKVNPGKLQQKPTGKAEDR